MAECTQTPIVEVSNIPSTNMVSSHQVAPRKEMNKTTDANQGNGETIVNSRQKGKSIEEGVQEEQEIEGRPWIEVGSNGKLSRYQKEKVIEQQRHEMIGSSNNPMGLSRAIPHQSQGKSKPWHRSTYQSNHASKPSYFRFDKTGKILSPLEKQPWQGSNFRGTHTSVNSQLPSVQNAFAVLSDYLGDIPEILAERERAQGLKKPHN
jgi:hypothetical protein